MHVTVRAGDSHIGVRWGFVVNIVDGETARERRWNAGEDSGVVDVLVGLGVIVGSGDNIMRFIVMVRKLLLAVVVLVIACQT